MTLLDIRGLVVRYGQLTAVHGIDLRVDEGEVVVLLGSNGAGKSSTLNAISGMVPSAAGDILFKGESIIARKPHRIAQGGIVQVPEGRRVIAPLSVADNLTLGAYAVRSKRRRAQLSEAVAELFPELERLADRPSGLLSGGEQQMLAFGRAMMADPSMLLLDEPSMGLAPIVVDRVIDAVKSIAQRGISILMVEQNASAAFGVATRAYVLEQGEITVEGPVGQVKTNPLVLRAFLGVEVDPDPVAANERGGR
jgi:branched-chain amino acid transport system ATP-binding protein